MFKIELGEEVEDIVTKIKGIVISRTEHITGCNTYSVQPTNKKNESELKNIIGFDEGRLKLKGNKVSMKDVAAKKPGADMRVPLKSK